MKVLKFLKEYKDAFLVLFGITAGAWALFTFVLSSPPGTSSDPAVNVTFNGGVGGEGNTIAGVINNHGLADTQFKLLLQAFSEGLAGGGIEPGTQTRVLENLLNQLDTHKLTIIELQETVEQQAIKIKSILNDDAISDEVKALIADGELVQAEALVDQHYEDRVKEQASELARKFYERGQVKALRLKYVEALEAFEKAAILQPENGLYQNEAGSVAHDLAHYDKAIGFYERALAIGFKTFGEDHRSVATYRNNLGTAWQYKGDLDKAIGFYELALASDLKTLGEEHPNVARDHNNLGAAWQDRGEVDKAIGYWELTLASDLKTFGEDHPNVAIRRNNLGSAWHDKREFDKAIGYYELALASDLKTFGEDHPSVATRRNNLGLAWKDKGDYDKAIEYYELALVSDLQTFGEDHPSVATHRNNLGSVWLAKGEIDKAIGYYELALASDLKTFGEEHPDVAIDWNNLGEAWRAKEEFDKAIEYYELALATSKSRLGSEHPLTKTVSANLELAKSEKQSVR